MKYVANKLLIAALLLLIPISLAYASSEEEVIEECEFTADIEKSWVFFTERPWVTGYVYNCDSNEYHEKDTVFVRILDINGDLVEDGWKPQKNTGKQLPLVTKYVFNQDVYRGGFRGNANVEGIDVVHIRTNQYFFYMPQIHSIDFDHKGVYQIELTYGDHVRTIWFASLNPDLPIHEEEEIDPCLDYEDRLVLMKNTLNSLEVQLTRYENLGQLEKVESTLELLEEGQKQIEALSIC